MYGVFYQSTDDCTYSCEVLLKVFKNEEHAEMLVHILNTKAPFKFPRWSYEKIEVQENATLEELEELSTIMTRPYYS